RNQIIKTIRDRQNEIILEQKMTLGQSIKEAFEGLSQPISDTIETEITVIQRSMTDVLEQRRRTGFDADTFEQSLRAVETAVKARVSEVRRLADRPPACAPA